MTDPDLNNKLDRLLTLLEAQLELTRQVSFNLDEQEDVNYKKYASPMGPRYVKSRVDPYNKSRTDHYALDQEEDSSIMAELNWSKPIATPFPKFNPGDMEIFILEAEAWFKFNQVYEQTVRGLAPKTQLGTININVMMTPRSGVSVDDDEVDGVGDENGDVDDNEVDGVGDKVGGVNMSVQCVDLMLEVIPRPQWTTAFGSILIQTANLLWAPSDIR
ncbi:hypothetical protein NDA17_007717 [Ustilago hordei]|nr:hypothetical protein NDA17_007717 [Ustilago hordei]